ncbi:MAG: glycosyltransferase, partial [Planctomycetota bacterium]
MSAEPIEPTGPRSASSPGNGIAADITAMVITFNEGANITRTLEAVAWVKEILVVDSGSTDETLAIVARYPNARV